MTQEQPQIVNDPAAAFVARIFIGIILAAIGAAATTGVYLGFTRVGAPDTLLRVSGSLFVVSAAAAGYYAGLCVWFAPLFNLRERGNRRRAIIFGAILVGVVDGAYLYWLFTR